MVTKIKDIVLAAGTAVANSGSADVALVLSANLAATDTITFNGLTYTMVASGATGNQINVGANLAATLDNIRTAVNAGAQGALITITDNDVNTLTVVYDTAGVGGNDYLISWVLGGGRTINADGAGAAGTGSHTLDGGTISLTNGYGSKAVELWGDGSLRFTTAGGQQIAIRDVQLNKLLAELVRENEFGVPEDHAFFGTGVA